MASLLTLARTCCCILVTKIRFIGVQSWFRFLYALRIIGSLMPRLRDCNNFEAKKFHGYRAADHIFFFAYANKRFSYDAA